MSKWIKKEDKVLVIAGNAKGTVGVVLARKGEKVVVKGVNVRKRHMKSREQGKPSQIIEMEKPIHISNVALCDENGQKMKVKLVVDANGQKSLVNAGSESNQVIRIIKKAV